MALQAKPAQLAPVSPRSRSSARQEAYDVTETIITNILFEQLSSGQRTLPDATKHKTSHNYYQTPNFTANSVAARG